MSSTRHIVLAALLVAALPGCKHDDEILAQAAQLGKLSTDTRATVNALAADVFQSCVRMNTLTQRTISLKVRTLATPGGSKSAIDAACATRKTLSDAIAHDAAPIFDYLDAVAAVGNYKPPVVDTTKAFTTLGATKNASGFYNQIAQALADFATAKFRVDGLRANIPHLNPAFQGAVADLQSAFLPCPNPTISYPGVLDAEDANAYTDFALILTNVIDPTAAAASAASPAPPGCAPAAPAASPLPLPAAISRLLIATPPPRPDFLRPRGRPGPSPCRRRRRPRSRTRRKRSCSKRSTTTTASSPRRTRRRKSSARRPRCSRARCTISRSRTKR